jgi:hypothetical protein
MFSFYFVFCQCELRVRCLLKSFLCSDGNLQENTVFPMIFFFLSENQLYRTSFRVFQSSLMHKSEWISHWTRVRCLLKSFSVNWSNWKESCLSKLQLILIQYWFLLIMLLPFVFHSLFTVNSNNKNWFLWSKFGFSSTETDIQDSFFWSKNHGLEVTIGGPEDLKAKFGYSVRSRIIHYKIQKTTA